MKQSQLFTKTRKTVAQDEVSKNAQLLQRAGFIYKHMAGAYAYLPLGWRVLQNICRIIREEMDALGATELHLTALQDKAIWEQSGRWSDDVVDNWFKTELKNGTALGLGFTHEEPLTALMAGYINSYKDLPVAVYQLQTKFRNEARAKSGILRGREFLMKDLYSFSRTEAEHQAFYERVKQAYIAIFNRVGIGEQTYVTFASGGSFSKYSHEFQTITLAGEDTIYVHSGRRLAINKEVLTSEVLADLDIKRDDLTEQTAVEVGNIFSLGTRFSSAFNLQYQTEGGTSEPVIMGSYGIGPGRLLGTVVEVLADDRGMVWPKSIAPFVAHLLVLGTSATVRDQAEKVYQQLLQEGIEVLFDDRSDVSAGEKFADADLFGMPYRLVVSEKTGEQVEIKARTGDTARVVSLTEVIEILHS